MIATPIPKKVDRSANLLFMINQAATMIKNQRIFVNLIQENQ